MQIVGLHQPVAVKQDAIPFSQEGVALLVGHAGHQAQRHSPRPELLCILITPQVGQVVSCVGVTEASALRLQESVEAGHEHVGWDAGAQRLVDPSEYLARRIRRLGDGAKHAAGRGHYEGCRHALARCVPYYEAKPAVFQLEEIVEIATNLACRVVVGSDLPAFQCRHFLRERGLLDALRHQKLLLDPLTLAYLFLQALLGQPQDSAPLAPLLGDLATHYPMDDDARRLVLLTGRRYAHEFPSVVHTPYGEAAHNLVVCRYLVFDDVAELGEGGVILGYRPLVTLAVRILARKQAAVDEVFGQYPIKRVQIPSPCASKKRRTRAKFSSADTAPPCQ